MFGVLLRGALVGAAALGGIALAWASPGCGSEPRFPICHTNDDCKSRDAGVFGPICYDLRCVECAYDSDCAAGSICNRSQACDPIVAARPSGTVPAPAATWSGTFEQCAAQCMDEPCVRACNEKHKE